MAVLLPLRFRILQLLSTKTQPVAVEDIMKDLESDYGGEKQFKKKAMTGHLVAMKALQLVESVDIDIDANDELYQTYRITEFGTGRLKYLPASYK